MQVSDEQLYALGEEDVNIWFELVVEMLDYCEEILLLQREGKRYILGLFI